MKHEPFEEQNYAGCHGSESRAAKPPLTPTPNADPFAEALANRLETLLAQAPRCLVTITQSLEGFDNLAASITEAAETALRKIEAACTRAEGVQKGLSETAERVATEGDNTQRKTQLLLNGLDAGDKLQGRLQECNEQVRLLTDESQKTAARHSEQLRDLTALCDDRLATLDQRLQRVVQDTVDAITRQIQATWAEADQRLTEQKAQASAAVEELRQTHQTVERRRRTLEEDLRDTESRSVATAANRLRTLEDTLRDKAEEVATARLRELEQEARKTTAFQLERVAELVDNCTERGQTLHRATAEAERQIKQLERMLSEAPVGVTRAEAAATALKQQTVEASAVQEAVKKLQADTSAAVLRSKELFSHRQTALTALIEQAKGMADHLQDTDQTARETAGQLVQQLRSLSCLEEKLRQTRETTQATLDATQSVNATLADTAAEAKKTAGLLEQKSTQAETVREALEKLAPQAAGIFQRGEETVAHRQTALTALLEQAKGMADHLQDTDQTARETAGQLGQQIRSLSSLEEKLRQTSETAQGALDTAKTMNTTLAETAAEAKKTAGLLEQRSTQADSVREALEKLAPQAAGLLQRSEETLAHRRTALANLLYEAKGVAEQLRGADRTARQTAEQLFNQFRAADRLEERLGDANEAGSNLKQQLAQAGTARESLEKLSTTAAGILQRGEEALAHRQAALNTLLDQSQNLAEDLRGTVQEAEQTDKQLAERSRAVAGVEERLAKAAEAAQTVAEAAAAQAAELTASTAKGQAVGAELDKRCAQATAAVASAQAASEKLHQDTDSLTKFSEAAIARHRRVVSELIEGAKRTAEGLQTGLGEARQTAERLTAVLRSGETLGDKLGTLDAVSEDWVLRLEKQHTETARALQGHLTQAEKDLASLRLDITTAAEERVARAKQDLASLADATTTAAEERLTQAKQDLLVLADSTTIAAEERVARTKQDLVALADGTTTTAEERLTQAKQDLLMLADGTTIAAEEHVARAKQDLVALAENTTTAAAEHFARLRQDLLTLARQTTATAEEQSKRIRQEWSELSEETGEMVSHHQQALTEAVGIASACSRNLQEVTDVAHETFTQLTGELRTGDELHGRLTQATQRMTERLEAARGRGDALAALCQQALQTAEAAEIDIKNLNQEASSIIKVGEEAAAEQRAVLDAATQEALALSDLLRERIQAAKRNGAELVSRTHSAVEAESALCRITAAAQETRDRMERAGEPLLERITQANALVDRLQTACTRAEPLQQKADTLNQKVAELIAGGEESLARQHDVLLAVVEDARRRLDDLRAGMAAAAQQREGTDEQYRQAAACATAAADRVDALIRDVWSLTTATEQRTRELAAEAQNADRLLKELAPAKEETESLRQAVIHQADVARELIEQLKVQTGSGHEAGGRLTTIQAESLRVADRLASHCHQAKTITERLSLTATELQVDHETLQANRATLDEWSQQSRTLGDMVQQAQVATDTLRVQINSLLTEPQTVVCDAKRQALQLTEVCRAVKKVFSGLSKTSLVANEKITQLARLHAEVTQATTTLQQWVAEAAHVQQRLENAVQRAPGIAQTHPPTRLYRLAEPPKHGFPTSEAKSAADVHTPADRLKAVSAAPAPSTQNAPTETNRDRRVGAAAKTSRPAAERRISPEEVADLIADAKRARERERELVPSP